MAVEETKHCPVCKKDVVVFQQKYSTFPGTGNEVRHYHDVICAYCGTAIEHSYIDEVPNQEEK